MIGVFHVTLTFLVTTLGRLLYVVDTTPLSAFAYNFKDFFQISNPKLFFLMINPLQIDALG